jgi:hypothetical protein
MRSKPELGVRRNIIPAIGNVDKKMKLKQKITEAED